MSYGMLRGLGDCSHLYSGGAALRLPDGNLVRAELLRRVRCARCRRGLLLDVLLPVPVGGPRHPRNRPVFSSMPAMCNAPDMASSSTPHATPEPAPAAARSLESAPSLEDELRSAKEDFESGDYIELTPEQLERCIITGESPWLRVSRG
jgi:hypothetical protein